MSTHYDLAIIGAGSAGLTAARFAVRLGKRVALIEANRIGGDCTWTGCVPSKALLHAARVADAIRAGGNYGIRAGEPEVDFPAVMARIRSVIEQIYAAGDCAGGFQFTHYAGYQGAMAVRNILPPGSSRARPAYPPWATFTDPEVAHVGYTEEQTLLRFGDKTRVSTLPMASVDRTVTDGATDGFIRVVYRGNGVVLGATVVGRNAAEALQPWALASEQGLKMGDVARVIQAYPSLGAGSQQVAWEAYLDRLTEG